MAQIFSRSSNQTPTQAWWASWRSAGSSRSRSTGGQSPYNTDVGYKPAQPIAYSHALHAGDLGMDCRYCHTYVERSAVRRRAAHRRRA